MEIEVLAPAAPFIEFAFDSGTSTPYITAPSSPQRFGNTFYFTNPAVDDLEDLSRASFSISPSLWEIDNPAGTSSLTINSEDFEFEFKLERDSASADELFDKGKIKPLEVPNPQHFSSSSETNSDKSKFLRVSDILAEEEEEEEYPEEINDCCTLSPISSSDIKQSNPFSSFLSTFSVSRGYRKWSFKDFLLFRSASEGRGTTKDPLRKFAAALPLTHVGEQRKSASTFRSSVVESGGGGVEGSVSSRRKGGGGVSAHELHYTANRAVAEEMKRKTTLPYRQGVLGCLGLNPNPGSGIHDLAKGSASVGSLPRG